MSVLRGIPGTRLIQTAIRPSNVVYIPEDESLHLIHFEEAGRPPGEPGSESYDAYLDMDYTDALSRKQRFDTSLMTERIRATPFLRKSQG